MGFTASDLQAIRTAIARGERSVQFADRGVTYRSMEELLAAESRISQALDAATTPRRSKQSRLVASKGFNPPFSEGSE